MNKKLSKTIVLLIAVVALLAVAVGGTVAYLITSTAPVTNTFTPASISTEVTDEVDGNVKKNVKITNKSNIPVYMRVAVVANWYKGEGSDKKIVAPWNNTIAVRRDWILGSDGYYYYTKVVAAGGEVTLFDSYTATGGPEGAHLEMDIIAQVIQAEPTTAVQEAWGFVPGSN
ncbi:MAG: hypothetical protein ACI4MU_01500 [Candidatus Ventricola sp.]